MNDVQILDILEKSKFALEDLFQSKITLNEEKYAKINLVDGKLAIDNANFFYIIQTKPNAYRLTLLLDKLKAKDALFHPLIFIIDYASKELIKFLKKKNIFFIDTVGNCYINTPRFKVSVEGRKALYKDLSIKRAFQKTGLKFLFKVLQNPDFLNGTYRKIASNTNISLASVSYIVDELKTDGFIVELKTPNQRHLSNLSNLIKKWAISYGENLRPKIHRGYFNLLDKSLLNPDFPKSDKFKNDFFFSGEYGLYHFNQFIKPKKLILYTNSRLSELVKSYKIVPIATIDKKKEPIEILEAFWLNYDKNDDFPTKHSLTNATVHPILIYADLLFSNNYRSLEAAEQLLQNEIRSQYLQYNLQW